MKSIQILLIMLFLMVANSYAISADNKYNLREITSGDYQQMNSHYQTIYERKLRRYEEAPIKFRDHQVLQVVALNKKLNLYETKFIDVGYVGTKACNNISEQGKKKLLDAGFFAWRCAISKGPVGSFPDTDMRVKGHQGHWGTFGVGLQFVFTLDGSHDYDQARNIASCHKEYGPPKTNPQDFDFGDDACFAVFSELPYIYFKDDLGTKTMAKPYIEQLKAPNGISLGGRACVSSFFHILNGKPQGNCLYVTPGTKMKVQYIGNKSAASVEIFYIVKVEGGVTVRSHRLFMLRDSIRSVQNDSVIDSNFTL